VVADVDAGEYIYIYDFMSLRLLDRDPMRWRWR
jgi:hypothetical protein